MNAVILRGQDKVKVYTVCLKYNFISFTLTEEAELACVWILAGGS